MIEGTALSTQLIAATRLQISDWLKRIREHNFLRSHAHIPLLCLIYLGMYIHVRKQH
ncbi:hypothetical protein DM02DRAFT_45207 [Periconia macrospinosa]|uniref:Uncharacterized protein n=1 Tax=Periconia macrospinosa TaxID=97972 RepID=A0A2V1DL39_9PLEO|nr:hypothetical protein DM02DRAFT_45207 [Periconia macrospinosa]